VGDGLSGHREWRTVLDTGIAGFDRDIEKHSTGVMGGDDDDGECGTLSMVMMMMKKGRGL
jgi:hypothetical protein